MKKGKRRFDLVMEGQHPHYEGRRLLLAGALLLLGLTGYEVWIRLDDIRIWTEAIAYMSEAKGESFFANMNLILQAPSIQELATKLGFLLLCLVYSILCLCLRNRPMAACVLLPLGLGMAGTGIWVLKMIAFSWIKPLESLKLLPFVLTTLGCILNLLSFSARKRRKKQQKLDEQQQRVQLQAERARNLSEPSYLAREAEQPVSEPKAETEQEWVYGTPKLFEKGK